MSAVEHSPANRAGAGVSTNSLDMVRIVRRAGRFGYWVQSWRRSPGTNTAWMCREQRVRLTFRGAMRASLRWPGPLVIETHTVREIGAR